MLERVRKYTCDLCGTSKITEDAKEPDEWVEVTCIVPSYDAGEKADVCSDCRKAIVVDEISKWLEKNV